MGVGGYALSQCSGGGWGSANRGQRARGGAEHPAGSQGGTIEERLISIQGVVQQSKGATSCGLRRKRRDLFLGAVGGHDILKDDGLDCE